MSTLTRDVNLLAEHAKHPSMVPARTATPPLLQLRIAGNALTLKPGLTYILGSAPEAHVHIGGSDIAPQHAKIVHDQLVAMQDALPTLLNGQRIGHGISAPLRDGDIIQLGNHQIHIGQTSEHDAAPIQRHEHSSAIPHNIPGVHTQQAGNINTHLLPSKDTSAGLAGAGLLHHDMNKKMSLGDNNTHQLPAGGQHPMQFPPGQEHRHGDIHTHGMATGPGVTHAMQSQQHHGQEQRSSLGQLLPGQVKTLEDGTTIHAGSQPTMIEQVRHNLPLQQQHQQPLQHQQQVHSGPGLARLSAHQKPEFAQNQPHHETMDIAHQPMTFSSANSGLQQPHSSSGSSSLLPRIDANSAVPIAVLPIVGMVEERLEPAHLHTGDNTTAAPLSTNMGGSQLSGSNQLGGNQLSGNPTFSDPATFAAGAALPHGITTHHTTAGSSQLMGSNKQGLSSGLGESVGIAALGGAASGAHSGKPESYVLAPAFSSAELASIMADMLDLSGSHMSRETRDVAVPHLLSLIDPAERQQMSSSHIKRWLHAAQLERDARLGTSSTDSSLQGHHSASAAGVSSSASHTAHAVDAALAARALGLPAPADPKELAHSDLLFGLLAMQAEEQQQQHKLSGISGLSSSAQLGAAKLASAAPLNMSSEAEAAGANPQTDYALMTLLTDLAEMGSWRLSSGWEPAVRYLLDEQHMSRSRRAQLASSAHLKNWLRAAVKDRDHSLLQGRAPQEHMVGAPANGDIAPIHLAQALISSQHQTI